jgi:cytochrome c-type biogenesis protein
VTLDEFLRHVGSGHGFLVALGVSFLGGMVASAVCPCTLPVGLGMATVAGASEVGRRRQGLKIAAAFFAGIVINLTVLGALIGRLGALTTESFGRYWALVMAILSLLAAAVAFRGQGLQVSQLEALRRPGLVGAFGYGFVFSLGTSVAPLLLLLTVSAASGRPDYGFLLAFAFGLGRGLPFLLAGVIGGTVARFTGLGRWGRTIQVVSGCTLLVVSIYYANTFAALL